MDNYNDERQRETKRLEDKKRKGDASKEFEKDNSQNQKSREEKPQHDSEKPKSKKKPKDKSQKQQNFYYDSSTGSEGDDDKHTLEENTPTRPLSNTKNLERTNSASSQWSDDYSEDQNRDVYRFCTHICSLFMHTAC